MSEAVVQTDAHNGHFTRADLGRLAGQVAGVIFDAMPAEKPKPDEVARKQNTEACRALSLHVLDVKDEFAFLRDRINLLSLVADGLQCDSRDRRALIRGFDDLTEFLDGFDEMLTRLGYLARSPSSTPQSEKGGTPRPNRREADRSTPPVASDTHQISNETMEATMDVSYDDEEVTVSIPRDGTVRLHWPDGLTVDLSFDQFAKLAKLPEPPSDRGGMSA